MKAMTSRPFASGFLLVAVPTLCMRALLLVGVGPWATTGIPILIALVALPAAMFASAFRALPLARVRATALSWTLLGLAAGGVIAELAGVPIRMAAFSRAVARAQPILDGIREFERENGRPPARLELLVPRYLERLPSRLPPLEIRITHRYSPNRWILESSASTGFLNWDALLYLPHGNYDDFAWGGWIERLGPWGYLHE
jgi:hypothetical protein